MHINNKRYLGIGLLLSIVGGYKMYSKGIYLEDGTIHWFNILVPFGMGIAIFVFVLMKTILEKKSN